MVEAMQNRSCRELNMRIDLKYLTFLAALVVGSNSACVAQADPKHDQPMQRPPQSAPGDNSDLLARMRSQNGTPKAKRDLYVAPNPASRANRDLISESRSQSGSPKSKTDPIFNSAPLNKEPGFCSTAASK